MTALLLSTYELGHQPLGLAAPLAHLRAAGVDVSGVDLSLDPLPEDLAASASFIGISVPMHTALRLGVQVARRVRALNPAAHICFYGLYAVLNSGYLLRTCADSVIGGEVEEVLTSRLTVERDAPFENAVTNLGRQTMLPPDRDDLPGLERYAHLEYGGRERLAGCTEASRGCAHQCLHCPLTPVYGGRLRIVPVDVVMADVRRLVALGAEHITFADPDFFNGVRHSLAVVRAMHAEFPLITFDATIKVEHLLEHRDLLEEVRRLGCLFIVSAVESLSDTVLDVLQKGHAAAGVLEALMLTRKAGIVLRPTLLPFTPWATLDDYLHLLDFVLENDLVEQIEPIQLAIRLLVPPGSSLLQAPAMLPFLGPLDEDAFAYRWRHPDPRMDALAAQVAGIVEKAARVREEPAQTLEAIRRCAREIAGAPALPFPTALPQARRHAPRLTEPWFC